ncbi:MAG TPA: triacylglycerol lipase [Burkholderiaceae bacterium]|nr:triacylglycerol lipase [Burkholderiaceae bacterium]
MKRLIARSALALACSLAAAVHTPAAHADTYTQTRHPIVLVHGLFGWDSMGPIDYWYGIPSALRAGGAKVYVTQQSAANASEVRGEQLLAELRRLKAAYGHAKFNLIGHSHGGHSVRYVAAVAPELVASVTTIGTPHRGSPVADAIKAGTGATGTTEAVAQLVNGMASVISYLSGGSGLPQNSEAAMNALTTAGSADFNRRFPAGAPATACGSGAGQVNGVRYYSMGGSSVVTNVLDPTEAILVLGSVFFLGQDNDGLVGRCSSRWGQVLRDDYPWNHIDQMNHAFGLRGLFAPDPVAVYRAHANRLKQAGL